MNRWFHFWKFPFMVSLLVDSLLNSMRTFVPWLVKISKHSAQEKRELALFLRSHYITRDLKFTRFTQTTSSKLETLLALMEEEVKAYLGLASSMRTWKLCTTGDLELLLWQMFKESQTRAQVSFSSPFLKSLKLISKDTMLFLEELSQD